VIELRYRRERFVDRRLGLRISVDHRIEVVSYHRGLLVPVPFEDPPPALLELKASTRHLPPYLLPVAALGLRRSSFSKYLVALSGLRPTEVLP